MSDGASTTAAASEPRRSDREKLLDGVPSDEGPVLAVHVPVLAIGMSGREALKQFDGSRSELRSGETLLDDGFGRLVDQGETQLGAQRIHLRLIDRPHPMQSGNRILSPEL